VELELSDDDEAMEELARSPALLIGTPVPLPLVEEEDKDESRQ